MTDTMKNSIINRWKRLATEDLGTWVTGPAYNIWQFFERILNNQVGDEKFCDKDTDENIAPYIRGFKCSTHADAEDCHLVMCLDLHFCEMSTWGIEDFDRYLMSMEPHKGAGRNYLYIWTDLVRADSKVKSRKRARKTA